MHQYCLSIQTNAIKKVFLSLSLLLLCINVGDPPPNIIAPPKSTYRNRDFRTSSIAPLSYSSYLLRPTPSHIHGGINQIQLVKVCLALRERRMPQQPNMLCPTPSQSCLSHSLPVNGNESVVFVYIWMSFYHGYDTISPRMRTTK